MAQNTDLTPGIYMVELHAQKVRYFLVFENRANSRRSYTSLISYPAQAIGRYDGQTLITGHDRIASMLTRAADRYDLHECDEPGCPRDPENKRREERALSKLVDRPVQDDTYTCIACKQDYLKPTGVERVLCATCIARCNHAGLALTGDNIRIMGQMTQGEVEASISRQEREKRAAAPLAPQTLNSDWEEFDVNDDTQPVDLGL